MSKRMSLILAFSLMYAAPFSVLGSIESLLTAGIPVKCGTPYLLEDEAAGKVAVANYRVSGMQKSALSSSGHFRVHYNISGSDSVNVADLSGNGIPDYVDSALVYLEKAYDVQVRVLGFDPPLPDGILGGGPELDVYLRNLSGIYGQTFTVSSMRVGNTAPAYLEIDNNFAESIYYTHGLDALKVTTAHEFFHTIQFRYHYDLGLNWWQEQSAVWMEDIVWPQVNDYFAYLRFFFQKKVQSGLTANYLPLDTRDGSFEYGAVVWPQYLSKRFGQAIIPAIWRRMGTTGSPTISDFDSLIPGGLSTALNEFAVWNYFTKDRGNSANFYSDGPLFPVSINIDTSTDSLAQGSYATPHLTSRYVEFLFSGAWHQSDSLRVSITPSDNGNFENRIIFFNSPTDYRIQQLSGQTGDVPLEGLWNRALLVTTCVNIQENSGFNYTLKIITQADETPLAFALTGTYPNPFNSSATISFTIPEDGGEVTITAHNALGQEVAAIFNGRLDGGEKNLLWKPGNLSGGLYFITISGHWGTKTVKTTFLK